MLDTSLSMGDPDAGNPIGALNSTEPVTPSDNNEGEGHTEPTE